MTPNGPTRKQEGDHGGLTTKVGYIGDMKVVDATSSYRADVGQTVEVTAESDQNYMVKCCQKTSSLTRFLTGCGGQQASDCCPPFFSLVLKKEGFLPG